MNLFSKLDVSGPRIFHMEENISKKIPLIIGHRGAAGHAPENTLEAFHKAHELGADGIELDIYLTKDKELVVVHDPEIKTPDGGKIGIRESTVAEIQGTPAGANIPTLRRVLEETGAFWKIINIEIKSTGFLTDGIEHHLSDLLSESPWKEKALVSSFNPFHLMRLKRIDPKIRTGYLMYEGSKFFQRKFWTLWTEAETINLSNEWAKNPDVYFSYLKLGRKIWIWTVNTEEDMRLWIGRGVDGIITNYPDRLKKVLADFE